MHRGLNERPPAPLSPHGAKNKHPVLAVVIITIVVVIIPHSQPTNALTGLSSETLIPYLSGTKKVFFPVMGLSFIVSQIS